MEEGGGECVGSGSALLVPRREGVLSCGSLHRTPLLSNKSQWLRDCPSQPGTPCFKSWILCDLSTWVHLSEPHCLVYKTGILLGTYWQRSWKNLKRFALKVFLARGVVSRKRVASASHSCGGGMFTLIETLQRNIASVCHLNLFSWRFCPKHCQGIALMTLWGRYYFFNPLLNLFNNLFDKSIMSLTFNINTVWKSVSNLLLSWAEDDFKCFMFIS